MKHVNLPKLYPVTQLRNNLPLYHPMSPLLVLCLNASDVGIDPTHQVFMVRLAYLPDS